VNNRNQLAAFYDYSPDGSGVPGRSGKGAGGCSFNLAVLDPMAILNLLSMPEPVPEEPELAASRGAAHSACGPTDNPAQVRKTPRWPQKLCQSQPFVAVFLQECMGQLASFRPT
jgi:hypothetical protein